jgi:hypothetical protein
MMEEIPGECRNDIVIPVQKRGDTAKLENYRETNLLNACYKLHSKILKEKFTSRAETFLLYCQNGFRKNRSCISPLYITKLLLEIIREFNLETHLAFLNDMKDFNRVRREKLFEILQSKNIPNVLLKSTIEIYSGNTIKVKQLTY